jgi:hypothetical protein
MQSKSSNRRNKIVLLVLGMLFTAFIVYTTWDFMGRTTHPGARKHLPNSILK